MKKVMLVFGTRPEAIKMCPLVNELKKRKELETVVCVTGQHRQMLDMVLEVFDVTPDYDLSIMKDKQTLFDVTTNILNSIKAVLEKEKPDVVLVHGDTSTTFVTALACFYMQIPVGHVEAGLRTYNIYSPYPEEFNRQAVSIISKFNFAPTELSKQNLLKEGKDPASIYVTGNTAIDALKTTVRENYTHPELEWAKDSRLIMITAHRRENLGEPMCHMFKAIRRVMDEHPDVKAIYPIHMNPAVRETANEYLGNDDRIHIIEPLDVLDFHNFLSRSYLILTDSGGIQEEAPSLGKPVLVMRDTTERPEGIAAGTLVVTSAAPLPAWAEEKGGKILTAGRWGAMNVEVKDGKIVSSTGALAKTITNSLQSTAADQVHTTARIQHPMVRKSYLDNPLQPVKGRGEDTYVQVSWEQALKLIHEQHERIRKANGPSAIFAGSYGWRSSGVLHKAQTLLQRYMNLAGGYSGHSGDYSTGAAQVIMPHVVGSVEVYEQQTSWPLILENSQVVVLWGMNPLNTLKIAWSSTDEQGLEYFHQLKKSGKPVIAIDPICSETIEFFGDNATWIAPNMGTDVALMLGLRIP